MTDGDCNLSPPSIGSYSPPVELILIMINTEIEGLSIKLDKNCNVTLYVGGVQVDYFPNVAVVSIPPFYIPAGAQPLQGFDDGFTGYEVQLIMQAVDGSGSVEWDWVLVVTQTSLTTPPALSNYPASIPDTLVNATTPVELNLNVDQPCVFTLTIDGETYKTEANYLVTTPVLLTIDPTYLNDADNIGVHTITISAVNSNGTSSILSYTWNLVGLENGSLPTTLTTGCLPAIQQWRSRLNSQSVWSAWYGTIIECTLNAAMNFAFYGSPSQSAVSELANFQWKANPDLLDTYAQPYIPPGGPKKTPQLFHAGRVGPSHCTTEQQGHEMLALFNPNIQNPQLSDYKTWTNWSLCQYGSIKIPAGPDTNCNNQIPLPDGSGETVIITISYINDIVIITQQINGISVPVPALSVGAQFVVFNVDSSGNVTSI